APPVLPLFEVLLAQSPGLGEQGTGTTAMAIVPLPLPPGAEARALLHHLLEHGDLVGRDTTSRTIIQLAVDDWVLEKFLTFNADAAEREDGGDDEPDADAEEDGSPTVIELMRPKVIRRRRHSHQAAWAEPMARRATIQLKVHRYIVQSIPLDEAD